VILNTSRQRFQYRSRFKQILNDFDVDFFFLQARPKADKNRQRVEEAFLKSTHQARAEAAAARREERRRLEKEKVMADEDPERQRRWEEKEQKRQAKKRAPKMKQLKVKAL
jgi:hypothetical protein